VSYAFSSTATLASIVQGLQSLQVPYATDSSGTLQYFTITATAVGTTAYNITLTAPFFGPTVQVFNSLSPSSSTGLTLTSATVNDPTVTGSAGTVSFNELVFVEWKNSIPVVALNRDDFFKLSSRETAVYGINTATGVTTVSSAPGSRALQYWYDRQITPRVWFWPIPVDDFQVFEMVIYQQIEDLGTLSNTIAVPNRWIKYVNDALAYEMAFVMPNVDPNRQDKLEARMNRSFLDADSSEEDFAPVRLAANTSAYTS
jgi:hypothetical protein